MLYILINTMPLILDSLHSNLFNFKPLKLDNAKQYYDLFSLFNNNQIYTYVFKTFIKIMQKYIDKKNSKFALNPNITTTNNKCIKAILHSKNEIFNDYLFEANNKIYMSYVKPTIIKSITNFINDTLTYKNIYDNNYEYLLQCYDFNPIGSSSKLNISLFHVISFLSERHNFKPMEVTYKTDNKYLAILESMNVIDYIVYLVKNIEWCVEYDYKNKVLSIINSSNNRCICLITENMFADYTILYQNTNNINVEYFIKDGNYNKLFNGKDCVGISNESHSISISNNQIILSRDDCNFNLIKKFQEEFGIIVPYELYMNITKNEEYYELSNKDNKKYIACDINLNYFEIKMRGCDEFLFESFYNIFGIIIPFSIEECRNKLYKIKPSSSTFIDKIKNMIVRSANCKLMLIIDNKKLTISTRYYTFSHQSNISNNQNNFCKIKYPKYELNDNKLLNDPYKIINTCREIFYDGADFYKNPLSIETPGLVTAYQDGPIEIVSYFSNNCSGNIALINTIDNKALLDIRILNNEDYQVVSGTEEHLNLAGELIVWKGVYVDDHRTIGLAQLFIPKHARIAPNSDGLKFRTNDCTVNKIYKLKQLYECFNCSNYAMYEHDDHLYCKYCTKSLINKMRSTNDKIILDKINIFDEEVDFGYSPNYASFKYTKKEHIKINNFRMARSSCDEPGIYFFFTSDEVLKYFDVKPSVSQIKEIFSISNNKPAYTNPIKYVPVQTPIRQPAQHQEEEKHFEPIQQPVQNRQIQHIELANIQHTQNKQTQTDFDVCTQNQINVVHKRTPECGDDCKLL
jgi:DNA-directed RNA polymerase subunit RPC12/RpoP